MKKSKKKIGPTTVETIHDAGEKVRRRLQDELEIASQEVDYLDNACDKLRKRGTDITAVHRYRARAMERKKDLGHRLENIEWLQEMLQPTDIPGIDNAPEEKHLLGPGLHI